METEVKLTILGSGTVAAASDRACASYLLETAKARILLDVGPDTLQQLVKAGKDYKDIDAIIFSHLDPDHSCGLPIFLAALNYTPGFVRKKKLILAGKKGLLRFVKGLFKVFGGIEPLADTYDLEIVELKAKNNKMFDLTIDTQKATHAKSSILLKIRHKDKVLVYTGDTAYDEKIIRFAKNCDVFMTECSHPDDKLIGKHLTPSLVGKLAEKINPKTLILTHFYPWVEKEDIRGLVGKYFSGEIILAKDFQVINI